MSRAFVKENDLEHAGIDIPERPLSDEPNYVTPNGLKLLNMQIDALEIDEDAYHVYLFNLKAYSKEQAALKEMANLNQNIQRSINEKININTLELLYNIDKFT